MNSFYTCSWVQNTQVINEQYVNKESLLNESIASILSSVMKKMKAANIGIPYRDARLYFYQFLQDKHPDMIPGEFRDQFATQKPQGKDINAMMGKMIMDEKTPKGFFDKLGAEFDEYSSEKTKIGDKEIDSVTAFLNRAAGSREVRGTSGGAESPKRTYGNLDNIHQAVQTGGVDATERVKKGANGYETLKLNLPPEAVLDFTEETPSQLGVYTTQANGLNYRVTLRNSSERSIPLSSLQPTDIASVVITEPNVKQSIEAPTLPGVEAPLVTREKPVVDFPPDKGGDFRGPDPEDVAVGKDVGDDEDEKDDEEDEEKPEEKKLSPQAINKKLKENLANRFRNYHRQERRYHLGY